MNKLPFVILVPACVLVVIIGSILFLRFRSSMTATTPSSIPQEYSTNTSSKPASGYGAMRGQTSATATLEQELNAASDDGGQIELDAMQKDTNSL